MKIRYRDKQGHFIKPQSAKRRSTKNVRSELYDEKNKNKKIGESVRGYYTQVKKLAREAMPQFKPKTQKRYTSRPKAKPLRRRGFVEDEEEYSEPERPTYPREEPDYSEEPGEEEEEELIEEWEIDYADDYGELDYMDDLEDLLSDEDEWYEG